MKENSLKKIYYLASTHWDREWHRSFQGFRYNLVKVTDNIIDVLEKDKDFTTFTFDGQTIVLDDFCKIEPNKRDRLSKLIAENRLAVGPWYVMPDEFLVSGESLIKNLQIGNKLATTYGASEPMKYGYICDIFGHIAQMPQIFNQFGIKGALLGRGTNSDYTPAHFVWESPDGSSCITFKVPEQCGYGTFWYDVWMMPVDGNDDLYVKRACDYIDRELTRSDLPYVVLMDGMDHQTIHEKAPWLAKQLESIYHCPVVFEPLSNLSNELANYTTLMPIKHGELNETGKLCVDHNMLITYTLSSRYDLKKENDQCQIMMEKWVQPFVTFAGLNGQSIQKTFLDEAYRYIVKCHAHDSICGCSIDAVHKDMHYRFRQAKSIGQNIINDILYGFSDEKFSDPQSNEYLLSIINPLPFERKEVITAEVRFKPNYPNSFSEQVIAERRNSFRLFDSYGNEISYCLVDVERGKFMEIPGVGSNVQFDCYTIMFNADLKACSQSEFKIIPSKTPVRCLQHLSTSINTAENDSVKLHIEDNGTITLTDKLTKREYKELLNFVDDSDVGDGWFHANLISERCISSKGFSSSIEKLYDHSDVCVFGITTFMQIPSGVSQTNSTIQRSADNSILAIRSEITFYKTKRYIDVTTTVQNNVKNHRIRLMLPTGIVGGAYEASQAFAFVKRTVGIDYNTHDWKESGKLEKAFENIVLKRNDNGDGLAFIGAYGLHECAGLDDVEGSLAITLFRSFSQTVLTNGEPDGQLQDNLEFKYRIQLLSNEDTLSDIMRSKDSLQTGVQCNSMSIAKEYKPTCSNLFGSINSKNTVVSIIKLPEAPIENCVVIRMTNYSNESDTANLALERKLKCAYETTMLEEHKAAIAIDNNKLSCTLTPWEIKTISIYFE